MHRTTTRPAPLDFRFPTTLSGIDRREEVSLPHLPPIIPIYLEAPITNGLRTPPADDMATTYQQPQYNEYASRRDVAYPATGNGGYPGAYSNGHANSQPRSYYSSLNNQTPSYDSKRDIETSQVVRSQPQSPQQFVQRESTLSIPEAQTRRKSADAIRPNLQIPRSISDSGSSLAEFAAQITCLFWFESIETLKIIEGITPSSSPIQRFRDSVMPSTGFRKWVVTVLSTTQVTENVILLALLFIYRLKQINPAVKGKSGSEYRLLTVALMLGNKFLDDNTYTNKTWAEVSGISVTEIHVMEVEFLSNMRYSLLASKEQWEDWLGTLRKYYNYCEIAAKRPYLQSSPQHADMPSPVSMQNSPPTFSLGYPAASSASSNLSSGYLNGHHWSHTSTPNTAASSPLHSMPTLDHQVGRKRSFPGEAEEPVAKRVTRSMGLANPNNAPMRIGAPRLPSIPSLSITTTQPMIPNYHSGTSVSQNAPLLPPLNGRAMSTVYPTTPTNWAPPPQMLTPTGPHNNSGHNTPSRRQSPQSVHDLLAYGSSPCSNNYSSQSQGYTSPSFFLQQRSSPYKPVRHVNTLLYPPPSGTMHDFSFNANQMHYQPLGKRNDFRSGVVPDYTNPAPYNQQWPVLPQLNFHA